MKVILRSVDVPLFLIKFELLTLCRVPQSLMSSTCVNILGSTDREDKFID